MATGVLTLVMLVVAAGCAKPALPQLDDARTTARVLTALLNDPQMGALRLEVTTVTGVVTLTGHVGTQDEERRAVELTRGVPGVSAVTSRLAVGPPGG